MSEKVNPTNYDPAGRKQAHADRQRVLEWEGDPLAEEYDRTLDDLAAYFASRPDNNEENTKYKDSLDKSLSKLEDGSRADEIILESRELRFAVMLARNIAKLKSSKVEDLNQDKTLDEILDAVHDKEVKVDNILAKYIETTEFTDGDLEAVLDRIHELMKGEETPEADVAASEENERTVIEEDDLEADESSKRTVVEEEDIDKDVEVVNGEIVDDEEDETEENMNDDEAKVVDGNAETVELDAVGQDLIPYEKPGLWQRLKNKYYGNFGRLHSRFMEFQKGKKGAFAVGLVLGAGAMYLMKKGDTETANVVTDNINIDTGGIDSSSLDTSAITPNGHETVVPQAHDISSSFSDAARHIDSGEGFYQTFKEMGIPQSEWSDLLDKVGPRLQEQGIAYPMGDSWGINMTPSGKMPDSTLRIIENARANR
ncbi:hypothetical protein KC939_01095 [Candidatus Saccharibacteria bacterium]|nr:hypothetical protein [Candidatus Saccharibacteria bacterium]